MMQKSIALMAGVGALLLVSSVGEARPRRRDWFARSASVGVSVGVGSPLGLGGAFVAVRPVRWVGFEGGAGLGGSFGPGASGTLVLSPFGTRRWALDVMGSYSRQFGWGELPTTPDGRTLPSASSWVSLGVASEWRPARSLMLRLGVGYSWLLHTSRYDSLSTNEIEYVSSNASISALPGATPLDAARAAERGETFGVWYVHLDIAPTFHW